MRDGTQREIAAARLNSEDQRHAANIESREYLAQFNASNEFIIAAARMDNETRLATLSAKSALDRAILSSDTQVALADFQQKNLNNRLDTQLAFELQKSEQDTAEIRRLKFLQDNPDIQTMLIDIAKKSKKDTGVFREELALKIAANPSLSYFPGGAEALFSTIETLATGQASTGIGLEESLDEVRQRGRDLEEGATLDYRGVTYRKVGDRLDRVTE